MPLATLPLRKIGGVGELSFQDFFGANRKNNDDIAKVKSELLPPILHVI